MTAHEYLKSVLESENVKLDSNLEQLNRLKQAFKELLEAQYRDRVTVYASGSFVKNTAIRSAYDLDLCAYFDKSKFYNEKEMYDDVYRLLLNKYDEHDKGGNIRRQHYSIGYVVDANRTIDIVPALRMSDDNSYATIHDTYPQSSGYTATNIHFHITQIAENKCSDVVRLLKVWKLNRDISDLKSYALELLTIKALENTNDATLLDDKVMKVWDFIIENLESIRLTDPSIHKNDLLAMLSREQKQTIIKRAKESQRGVLAAWDRIQGWKQEIPKRYY